MAPSAAAGKRQHSGCRRRRGRSDSACAVVNARSAHSRIRPYSMREKPSIASAIISSAATGDVESCRFPMARASRAWASAWRPSRCSTPAHAVSSRTRSPRLGRHQPPGSRAARGAPGRWPVADEALARASNNSTRSSMGVAAGSSRRASLNQTAALAGARSAMDSPASRRTATAARSPWRAERATWWARSAAEAPWA